jgi:hypothetical protein
MTTDVCLRRKRTFIAETTKVVGRVEMTLPAKEFYRYLNRYPYLRPQDHARSIEGLRKAGLKE